MIILLSFILFVCQTVCVQAGAIAKVTLKVVDEDMKPVEGANLRMCFYGGCLKKDATIGITDSEGIYSGAAYSKDGQVGGAIEKPGYYSSSYHADFMAQKLGFWLPHNKEITVVLRPKINPVPMYVREKWLTIPAVGKEIGFDLVKFDWVIPYGQGGTSDFIFRVERQYKDVDNFDVTMALTFSNEFDGIQLYKEDRGGDYNVGSIFRLLRHAPEFGYAREITKRRTRGGGVYYDGISDDNNYFFRVRSEKGENGNLIRAMYGKIKGDIRIDPRSSKTVDIHLFYYLNPDYTRNLEFDPTRNLFSPLPKGEYPIGLP